MHTKGPLRNGTVLLLLAAAMFVLAGCNSHGSPNTSASRINVIAAENFWGSLATQLGGRDVQVRSIIDNPEVDPHSYEPTARDARMIASAQMVLVNGIGYDEWARHLLAADTSSGTLVLDVGGLLGLSKGANPHQWYSPTHVHSVIAQITADYDRLRPAEASYFNRLRQQLETVGLARYEWLLREIRSHYAGVAVGYSESIFQPLGDALGLKLLTPYSFTKAIAEGSDVSAADKQAVDRQIEAHKIKIWVFNSQNITPDVRRANELVQAKQIPIARITETLSPPSASFQDWQVAELERLQAALHQARSVYGK